MDDFVTVEQLQNIFGDLSRYVLIPHYDKKPAINSKTLSKLREYIFAGEVNSPKKFLYCIKNFDSLVPVIFSDIRIKEDMTTFSPRQTYLDLDEFSFNGVKLCLFDNNKVSLSKNLMRFQS